MDVLVGIGDAAEKYVLEPGDVFQDFEQAPEMVVVSPGKFMMGSPDDEEGRKNLEGPQHEMTISEPFAMGRYAITFDEWDTYIVETGDYIDRSVVTSRSIMRELFGRKIGLWQTIKTLWELNNAPSDQGWGRGRMPLLDVSWIAAKKYIKWLNCKTGHNYCLPSEAEWEYAARAGSSTPYWWGETIRKDQANCNYGDGACRPKRTMLVDAFGSNPFGLYQVHGNVLEWVEDSAELHFLDWRNKYHKNKPKIYPRKPGKFKIARGGCYGDGVDLVRSASRGSFDVDGGYTAIGFRIARRF